MAWTARYLDDLGVVETVYSGLLSAADLRDAALATLTLGRERGTYRFLGNCRDLLGGCSIVDLYSLAERVTSFNRSAEFREALVLPDLEAPAQDVRFWETTCVNRGLLVRVFATRDSAIEWLTLQPVLAETEAGPV
jgi:hypothetical protein